MISFVTQLWCLYLILCGLSVVSINDCNLELLDEFANHLCQKNNDAMKLDELLLIFGSFQIELQYLKKAVFKSVIVPMCYNK